MSKRECDRMQVGVVMKRVGSIGKEMLGKGIRNGIHRGLQKEDGIDGILVTIGLCIIALVLCVVMKDSLATFINTIVSSMTDKANAILQGV